jgi:hypothetical protein
MRETPILLGRPVASRNQPEADQTTIDTARLRRD